MTWTMPDAEPGAFVPMAELLELAAASERSPIRDSAVEAMRLRERLKVASDLISTKIDQLALRR